MTRTANLRDLLENLFCCSPPRSQRCIFLWNVLISLRRSWCYTGCRSLCLHSYSNIFFQSDISISSRWPPWWELDMLTFHWQVNFWRVDRRHQRHVSRLRYPFPSLPILPLCSPGAGAGVLGFNVCWLCAAGLSEPLPHDSVFCCQL